MRATTRCSSRFARSSKNVLKPVVQACERPRRRDDDGKTLHLSLASFPDLIDPQDALFGDEISQALLGGLTLLRYDEHMALTPAAAEAYSVSEDGLIYTFHLRPNLRYSDGVPITTQDVAFALKRIGDGPNVDDMRSLLEPIVGYTAYLHLPTTTTTLDREHVRAVIGIHAVDDRTLTITLTHPTPRVLHLLALWVSVPTRPDQVLPKPTTWTDGPLPVSSGPYRLVTLPPQDLVWERNPFFTTPGLQPFFDRIVVSIIPDPEQALMAYCDGRLDLLDIGRDAEPLLAALPSLAAEVVSAPSPCIIGVTYPVTTPPFDQRGVRNAFGTSLDREAWTTRRIIIGNVVRQPLSSAFQQPRKTLIPPGFPFSRENDPPYGFDQTEARNLLAATGVTSPAHLDVPFFYPDNPFPMARYQWLSNSWHTILGVHTSLNPISPTADHFLRDTLPPSPKVRALCAITAEPSEFLWPFRSGGYRGIVSSWQNIAFDQLLEAADTTLDAKERHQLYLQAEDLLLAEEPFTVLASSLQTTLVQLWLLGVIQTPFDPLPGLLHLDTMRLAP